MLNKKRPTCSPHVVNWLVKYSDVHSLFNYLYSYSLQDTIIVLEVLCLLVLARVIFAARASRRQRAKRAGKRFRFPIDCMTGLYLVTRAIILLRLAVHTNHKTDLNFYHSIALRMFSGEIPYKDFLFQYPPLSLVLIGLPGILCATMGWPSPLAYKMCYRLLACCFDALTYRLVRREAERRGRPELAIYHIAVSSIFAFILFDRLDVIVTFFGFYALTGITDMKQAFRRAFAIGLGTLVKLTPICLLPVLLFDRLAAKSGLRDLLKIVALTMVPVAAGFLLVTVLSPRSNLPFIAYHEVRGIEVESTWSSAIILARLMGLGFGDLSVQLNAGSQSSDLAGHECDVLAAVINWIMVIFLSASTMLLYWRRRYPSQNRALFFGTFILISFLICSKVFSPQYMIWLTPLAPFAFADLSGARRAAAYAGFYVACILTTLIFPLKMGNLVALETAAAFILAARNAIVVFIWLLLVQRLLKRGEQPG